MIKKHKKFDRDHQKHGKDAQTDKKPGRSEERRGGRDKDRTFKDKPSDDKPYKDKNFKGKPSADKPYKDKTFKGKPSSDKPYKDKTFKGKPSADKPYKDKAFKDKPSDDKTYKDKVYKGKPSTDKPRKDQSVASEAGKSSPKRGSHYGDKPRFVRSRSSEGAREIPEKKVKNFDEPGEGNIYNAGEEERLFLKGRHEVVQALESGQQIDSVVISTAVKGPVGSVVRELASKVQIPVKEMNPDLFARKFGEKSQGIAAIVGAFAYCSFEEIAEKATSGRGVLVALNHVEDARNLGAIVRTVEASGCSGVLIPKNRSAGMTEWAIRTAQGAASYLPVARVNNIGDALEKLKEMGYWVVGLDGDAEKKYDDVVYSGKIVVVAGGEDAGLGERVRKVCDDVVSIPLLGKTPSLNVSVSTAVVLYEVLRQKLFFKNSAKNS